MNDQKPKEAATYTGQNVTIDDLILFQLQLLGEIKKIIKESVGESSKRWLRTEEVKDLLGISTTTLTTIRANGMLPVTKIGGTIYYDYHDIQRMMEQNKENI